jgi:uroporphyrinogen-III synthase
MESDKKYLLSTRPLPKAIIEEGAIKGVIIEELSFIDTRPVQDDSLHQRIKTLSSEQHTVVFTSMNAVDAVAAQVSNVPAWQIYSIGNTTRKLIEEAWGTDKIVATAENAQRLGERMIDDGVGEVIFFCSNIRRNELPNKIRSEGGKVEEIVVYETEGTATKVGREYDGILFLVPALYMRFMGKICLLKTPWFLLSAEQPRKPYGNTETGRLLWQMRLIKNNLPGKLLSTWVE